MLELPVAGLGLPPRSEFHHIGCATASIEAASTLLREAGYVQEGAPFRDEAQGVAGSFLVGPGPRLELLENLPGADTLTPFLDGPSRMYHLAYLTPDLDVALAWARENRGRILRPPTPAVAFGGRPICFVAFRHGWIIEFIQSEPLGDSMSARELDRLEDISARSIYSAGVMDPAIRYCFRILQRHLRGPRVLEMGPAEGVMTDLLVTTGCELAVVEGSAAFCESLRKRHPGILVHHALFEAFEPRERFDTIVLGHVLEHVEDPVAVLQRARSWLASEGRIFAAVPNARSLHRQAAVLMKMLPVEDALNDKDRYHGHRIVFQPESFRRVFHAADLRVDLFGGYWLKPVSNSQIEATWTHGMIDAFMQLGERYPDIAGEMYVVASNLE